MDNFQDQLGNFNKLLSEIEQYYTQKNNLYGNTPQGVDWNSQESQTLRFAQLLKVCDHHQSFSINDYGCGYGALLDYLNQHDCQCNYYGFDISEAMIKQARELHKNNQKSVFLREEHHLNQADYTVASGIFNVKLETADEEWISYIIMTINKMANLSKKGFAFNILTKYSDAEFMRSYLYYADPCYFFDYCKRNFSRNIALLHDYNLYEFTIIVRN